VAKFNQDKAAATFRSQVAAYAVHGYVLKLSFSKKSQHLYEFNEQLI
jgi:hypothetical protein